MPEIDRQIGIEIYATKALGVGGAIRRKVEDFQVEEVLVDGSRASIEKAEVKPVLHTTAERQRFLLCVLVKRNWDTFQAVKKVAQQLGIDQRRIQIAGIKDAKAVTAQHVTIEGVTAEEAGRVQSRDVELRPVGYFHEPLSAFYLLGNQFTIKISKVPHAKTETADAIRNVMAELEALGGIPNFYGHQRFGTTRPITHLVGKAMVHGGLEEAAMVFLAQPSPNEHPESRQARINLQGTRDFQRALTEFPSQLRYERQMLRHLAAAPGDFAGAFRRLPPKLGLLFVQAYQSYLFNRFLSERVKASFSLAGAEVGDYVVNVERSGLPMIRTGRLVTAENKTETNKQIEAGKLRLALPVVGFKQRLSQGAAGELQQRVLEEEAVDLQGFRVEALSEVGARGELRAAVAPVKDFALDEAVPDADEADKSEVRLRFRLLRSSYATVLLREVMKPQNPLAAGF